MRIFVGVGSQKFQLNRLLKELDEFAKNMKGDVEIFAQTGYSTYVPKYYSYTQFLPQQEYIKYLSEADLLIIHAGVGTIMEGLNRRKKMIVYPRKVKYGEHVDDHQLDIAQEFGKKRYVLVCDECPLNAVIERAKTYEFSYFCVPKSKIAEMIYLYINSFDDES